MDLREYLFKNKISQTDFAYVLELSRPHLCRLVHRVGYPSRETAIKIEELTNGEVTFEELMK